MPVADAVVRAAPARGAAGDDKRIMAGGVGDAELDGQVVWSDDRRRACPSAGSGFACWGLDCRRPRPASTVVRQPGGKPCQLLAQPLPACVTGHPATLRQQGFCGRCVPAFLFGRICGKTVQKRLRFDLNAGFPRLQFHRRHMVAVDDAGPCNNLLMWQRFGTRPQRSPDHCLLADSLDVPQLRF
jgi:hypothetical protein